jgi:hypothetical protein
LSYRAGKIEKMGNVSKGHLKVKRKEVHDEGENTPEERAENGSRKEARKKP